MVLFRIPFNKLVSRSNTDLATVKIYATKSRGLPWYSISKVCLDIKDAMYMVDEAAVPLL